MVLEIGSIKHGYQLKIMKMIFFQLDYLGMFILNVMKLGENDKMNS
jgi:hypothetical protein